MAEEEHEVCFKRRRKRAGGSVSKLCRSIHLAAKEDPFYMDVITKAPGEGGAAQPGQGLGSHEGGLPELRRAGVPSSIQHRGMQALSPRACVRAPQPGRA
ncbi:hypothetical protein PAHAL_1G217200 [Panicum hallii]|jgi:hypothetical protein|uniref:Uncharacterized protein n=1 Tax=Panicum hallii TaxID=206008 RepID=A0A2T8KW03_9POAL|nr:hypothetical protein PAHAL_1G217200 [Panicum hallii]